MQPGQLIHWSVLDHMSSHREFRADNGRSASKKTVFNSSLLKGKRRAQVPRPGAALLGAYEPKARLNLGGGSVMWEDLKSDPKKYSMFLVEDPYSSATTLLSCLQNAVFHREPLSRREADPFVALVSSGE